MLWGPSLNLAQKSMELFAKDVLPELKKLNPAPLKSAAAAV